MDHPTHREASTHGHAELGHAAEHEVQHEGHHALGRHGRAVLAANVVPVRAADRGAIHVRRAMIHPRAFFCRARRVSNPHADKCATSC